jgi:N-acetylmuramoyl-L-alanine amidase
MGKKGSIVLDAGHGGQVETGGSSANNAVSPSGVLEKNVTLRFAFLVREALAELAQIGNHDLEVTLTRERDVNLGLVDRSLVAKEAKADLFLSIHCNASTSHTARGVETLIRPTSAGNGNHAADKAFAQKIQDAVFNAVKAHDPKTRDRKVKDQVLGVLRDENLASKTRACLVELEFIDTKAVDELLNIGPDAWRVDTDIAKAIAAALVDAL